MDAPALEATTTDPANDTIRRSLVDSAVPLRGATRRPCLWDAGVAAPDASRQLGAASNSKATNGRTASHRHAAATRERIAVTRICDDTLES